VCPYCGWDKAKNENSLRAHINLQCEKKPADPVDESKEPGKKEAEVEKVVAIPEHLPEDTPLAPMLEVEALRREIAELRNIINPPVRVGKNYVPPEIEDGDLVFDVGSDFPAVYRPLENMVFKASVDGMDKELPYPGTCMICGMKLYHCMSHPIRADERVGATLAAFEHSAMNQPPAAYCQDDYKKYIIEKQKIEPISVRSMSLKEAGFE